VPPEIENELALLLADVRGFLRQYVVMTDFQADAAALWVFHTHAFEAAETTPYLHVCSAERESGKTRLLEALELVVARPLKTGGTTAAALARSVAADPPPTFLLDETDNALKREREYVATLLGILNDGYRRGGRTLLCLPPKWEPTLQPVFAPKVVAGIGELPDTLASRVIRFELKRRAPGEHVERFRRRDAEIHAEPIHTSASALGEHLAARLTYAYPKLPDELGDRAQDCWEPLIAIADLASVDEWPARARTAAIALSSGRPTEDDSLGVRLLGDIHNILAESNLDRLSTADLISRLRSDEEAPWDDLHGKPLTPRTLARLLKPFGVRSRTVRLDDESTPKGFHRDQFDDAFSRYLAADSPMGGDLSATSATTVQASQKQADFNPPQEESVADTKEAANPHGQTDVALWRIETGGKGETVVLDGREWTIVASEDELERLERVADDGQHIIVVERWLDRQVHPPKWRSKNHRRPIPKPTKADHLYFAQQAADRNEPACAVCGSTDIHSTSGRCKECGERVAA
jgi:hypothetical protein